MFHHGGQRHLERPGEFAHGQGILPFETGEQRASRGVGERREGPVENRFLILNHVVKY